MKRRESNNLKSSVKQTAVSTRQLHTLLWPRTPNGLSFTTRCWRSTPTVRGAGDGLATAQAPRDVVHRQRSRSATVRKLTWRGHCHAVIIASWHCARVCYCYFTTGKWPVRVSSTCYSFGLCAQNQMSTALKVLRVLEEYQYDRKTTWARSQN